MKEQILNIIKSYIFDENADETIAKEVAIHITEFIKWKDEESIYIREDRYVYYGASKNFIELYQYWIDNIKDQ